MPPADCLLGSARVITEQGVYEIVQAIDGDWVRCISGTDWISADYGAPLVKVRSDYQTETHGSIRQWFETADGRTHDAGEFQTITYE